MSLHVEERGAGSPVVLIHGTPMGPDHLRPLAARLSETYRVLVPHLPGYGRSAPLEPYSLQRSLEALEEALESRALRGVHLVGLGAGGYRALALACRARIRIRSVAVLGAIAAIEPRIKQRLATAAEMIRDGVDPSLLLDDLLSPRGREEPRNRAEVERWGRSIAPEHLAREIEALVDAPGLHGQIGALRAPVLLRVGSIDATVSPEGVQRFLDHARSARFEEVPGVGHALLCEDFEKTAASIEAFLASAERVHSVVPARGDSV